MSAPARVVDDDVGRLEARLVALELAVEDLRRRIPAPTDADDGAFVATIAVAVKGCAFSSDELRRHAKVDPALARVIRDDTAVQVGRRLRALLGRDVGGWIVERIGRDASGIVWGVVPARLHAEASARATLGAE